MCAARQTECVFRERFQIMVVGSMVNTHVLGQNLGARAKSGTHGAKVNYRKSQGHLFKICSKICSALSGLGLGWSILLLLGLVLGLEFWTFGYSSFNIPI